MSNRHSHHAIQTLFRQASRLAKSLTKGVVLWLMRTLMLLTRRPTVLGRAPGFVLPTVTMVSLVVIVLTGAMIIRSYDRAKNASNVRVDQAVLNAGAPAIDRARAKLIGLFEDPKLPSRGTPNDVLLQQVLAGENYTFSDEIRLKMVADFTNNGGANNAGNNTFGENARPYILSAGNRVPNANYQLVNDESSINAWKFPVDTDSNGRFDAYTLYAINYRLPKRNNNGEFERSRSPLDARTPPMDAPAGAGRCASASGAASVTGADWYSSTNRQTKAFFIYTVTVPIAQGDPILSDTTLNPGGTRYEVFRQQAAFSALETQQDYARAAVNNNAILFEDDLSLSSGPPLRISGRVFTNSNLFLRGAGGTLDLFQVSSPASCFYKEENSKIVAGGNVKKGAPGTDDADGTLGGDDPGIHLYRVPDDDPGANDVNTDVEFINDDRSTGSNAAAVSYNSLAYNERISLLVDAVMDPSVHHPNNDPTSVAAAVNNRLQADPSLDRTTVRREEFEIYFRNRTRRVPNSEVNYLGNPLARPAALGGGNYTRATVLQGTSATDLGPREQLRPPTGWMFPLDYTNNTAPLADGYTGLTLRTAAPRATDPAVLRAAPRDKEQRVGDRILVGNNLPALWYLCDDGTLTCTNGRFVGKEAEQPVKRDATTREQWTNGTPNRTRRTQAEKLDNLDTIARDALWETKAAETPKDPSDASQNVGGLRVIVGAGVYERQNSFLPPPPDLANVGRPSVPDDPLTNVASTAAGGDGNPFPYEIDESRLPVVWPDTMPMSPGLKVYDNDPTLPANANNREVDLAANSGANIQNLLALTTTLNATTTPDVANPLGAATGTARPIDAGYASVDPRTPKYAKGDLRMRTAVVYHHRRDGANPTAYSASPTAASLRDAYQTPIACISSYYDPSTPQTARNMRLPNDTRLPDVSGGIDRIGARTAPTGVLPATGVGDGIVDQNLLGRDLDDPVLGGFAQNANAGKSNNGVVYAIDPATDWTAARLASETTIPATALPDAAGNRGLFGTGTEGYRNERSTTLLGKLYYQANLVYPNGRFVNEPLRRALYSLGTDAQKRLTLSEQAAIDSALCSLRILGDPSVTTTLPNPATNPIIPHGAIKEVTMLDPRQPKAIDGRFIRVASASATASTGTGTNEVYTITYRIPESFRPNWNGLPNSTLDDGTPGETALTEIFDDNTTTQGDVVTVQGFESVNPRLNAQRGVITAIDNANGTITVRVRGSNPTAIASTPAPNATAGITETQTAELDMPLEDRQPAEVRVTQLDLNLLRTTELLDPNGAAYDPREFMIPNSGIIYVSRDDAMVDMSDVSDLINSTAPGAVRAASVNTRRNLSSVDFRLDPTRRIGGVMLINGNRIDRVNQYRDVEKGLIVATNLMGYVQADTRIIDGAAIGNFNLHADPTDRTPRQEFTVPLADDWSNFYTRTVAQINPNFACRPGGLSATCTSGDSWRTAVLLADGFSPLSRNYRTGYRSNGDFDLNNNEDTWISRANRLKNGFFTNDFAINGLSGASRDNAAPFRDNVYATDNANVVNSSYFNNYVTPIQRRSEDNNTKTFPVYVMEICRKLPVSACTPKDWVMGYDLDGDGTVQQRLEDMRGSFPNDFVDFLKAGGAAEYERDIQPWQLGRILRDMAGRKDDDSPGAPQGALEGSPTNDEARWTVEYTTTTAGKEFRVSPMNRLGAGTTGLPALELGDRRFARRVAFARDLQGKLVFSRNEDINGNGIFEAATEDLNRNGAWDRAINVKPIGVGCPLNLVAGTTPTPKELSLLGCYYRQTDSNWGDAGIVENGVYYGRPGVTTNNLFFRATNNRTGDPSALGDVVYATNRPLYIMGEAQGGNILQLPPTPDIPGVRSLNLPAGATRASGYSLCTNDNAANGGSSRKPTLTALNQTELGRCRDQAGDPMQAIENFQTDVFALDDTASATDNIVAPIITGLGLDKAPPAPDGDDDDDYTTTITDDDYTTTITSNPPAAPNPNQPVVNLIKLGALLPDSKFPTSATCKKIKLVGGANDVFIFRYGGGGVPLDFGDAPGDPNHCGIQVELKGVDANNVFWVSDKDLRFNQVKGADNKRHKIIGTFVVPGVEVPKWETVDFYGRLLGPNGKPNAPNFGNTSFTATSSDAQPLLVPVLQYTAIRDDADNGIQPSNKDWQGDNSDNNTNMRWRQAVPDGGEDYNLVIAVGNNPARIAPRVEGDGGIGNFPRFIENWHGEALRLNGGLLQIKRSSFTTASDRFLLNEGNFTNPANWTTFGYFQAYKTGNAPIGRQWGINASYQPPNRLFGFDPAILGQLPDLFTEQFARPEPVKNEFFQQLDRGDRWVQALLCATQPGTDQNTPLSVVGTATSTDATVRRGYYQRVGIANADTGDIPYRYPAIPLNNPFRPRNSQFCPTAFTQYPSTCTATGTTDCNP